MIRRIQLSRLRSLESAMSELSQSLNVIEVPAAEPGYPESI